MRLLNAPTRSGFEIPRPKWDEVKDTPAVQAALAKEVRIVEPDYADPVLASFP